MSTETQANRAYQHLREKLIAGDFEPGTRLLYGPIGKEIGISATPVREAAGRLANEGLVDLIPNLGAVVRTLDRTELIEIYEVRLAIEPYAARLAGQRATTTQLARLETLVTRMEDLSRQQSAQSSRYASKRTTRQFDKADYGFHLTVIEATGNQAMLRTAGQSHVLTRVFGIRRHRYTADSLSHTCREHRQIFEAIRNQKPEQAAAAAADHITHGLRLSLLALDETLSSRTEESLYT